jgi:hypothetical protein
MRTYQVVYDLRAPGRNYEELHKALKNYPNWARPTESTWIINSGSTAEQIANDLMKHIDTNDRLLVTRLSGEWASYGLQQDVVKWLTGDMAA